MDNTYNEFLEKISDGVTSQSAKNTIKIIEKNDVCDIGILKSVISLFSADDYGYELIKILLVSLVFMLFLNVLTNVFENKTLKLCVKISVSLSVMFPVYKFLILSTEYIYDISVFLGILAPTAGTVTALGGNIFSAEAQGISFSVVAVICQVLINIILPIVVTFYIVISVVYYNIRLCYN